MIGNALLMVGSVRLSNQNLSLSTRGCSKSRNKTMQRKKIKRTVRTAAILLAAMMTVSFSSGTLFTFGDTGDDGSAEEAATEESQDAVEDAEVVLASPVAAKALKVTQDGAAAKEVANQEAIRQAIKNPLTGIGGYNEKAVGKRPLAVVVENDPKARPQWGIDDPEKSPDIILEGEMEGGETRTLWFWADMTGLPSKVGPTRSARPPYVRFSELFDAIFIHCGFSRTTWDYTGADTVFEEDNVDHIDMLHYDNATGVFDRDYSRTSMLEHTAFLHGEKVLETVQAFGYRTNADTSRYTTFTFEGAEEENAESEKGSGVGGKLREKSALIAFPPVPEEPAGVPCRVIDCEFSSATDTRHWEYSETDQMYHTQDYYTDVARTNVLILFDTTKYISKADYWGAGQDELYCDYLFTGGQGKLAKNGRIENITWEVEDGRIVLKDANGEPAELAPGKTWIGWCSENKNGSVSIGE